MKVFLPLICIFLLFSCENKIQLKDYYYPIDALKTGKVYIYTPVENDSLSPFFLYLSNVNGYLIGTKYNEKFNIEQITTEEVVKNGTLLTRLQFCENSDSICLPILAKIEQGAVFPFEIKDTSSLFVFQVNWTQDEIKNTVLKNRHFLGFETKKWKEKVYDCAKFGIREEISVGNQSIGFQTFKAFTEEYYTKGIGLIYSKKNIDQTFILEYELKDTTSMSNFEKIFLEK